MKTIVFSLFIVICSVAMFPHTTLAQDARPVVRLIYFVPKDRTPQPDIDEKLDTLIKDVQTFYADQMEAHGFGRKTFQFETDARGKAVVHHVNGRFTDQHYHAETDQKVRAEIGERFDLSQTIHFISIDIGNELIGEHACGIGGIEGTVIEDTVTVLSGYSLIPASGACFVGNFGVDVAAHELGHVFGLQHDFRDDTYLMSYGKERSQLSDCAAEWLDVHPAFNPRGTSLNQDTTLEILTPNRPPDPNAISFRFEITDPDGIHQVQLLTPTVDTTYTAVFGSPELLDYKQLNGSANSTVAFVVTGLTEANESVSLQVIDSTGNITMSKPYGIYIPILEMPPEEVVSISDPHLAAAVQEQIGGAITTHTILSLRRLSVRDRGITDLTGLEHAHNLEYLYARENPISDVSPLAGLTQLTELLLVGIPISDISPLAGMTQLIYLDLRGTQIVDISPLAGLTQLKGLWLSSRFSDITPLAGLTQLERLYFLGGVFSDISPLAELTQLERLDLRGTEVSDISPLAGLTQLKQLWLFDTPVSDISPLAGLIQLEKLWLSGTAVSDIAPLAGLTQLTSLDFKETPVSDVTPLAGLTQLIGLGLSKTAVSDITPLAGLTQLVDLDFYNTAVSDIAPLAGLTQLKYLWAIDTAVSDITPLAGLTQLKHLFLNGNSAVSDITPLAGLTQLTHLFLGWTAISDVSALAEMTKLTSLSLRGTAISDVSVLAGMTQLTKLHLSHTAISDLAPLTRLTHLTHLGVAGNPLSYVSINTHIPAIQAKGTQVIFTTRTPRTLETIAGTRQSGLPNTTLPLPFVVEVGDGANGFSEVPVTFAITSGDGKLSVTTTKTDADGRAQTRLTLGTTAGTTTVQASVPEIAQPVKFTAKVVYHSTQIAIRDTALRTRIAETLGKPRDGTITVADMLQLTELTANNANIRELTVLQHAANLTTLSLDNNAITDATSLAGLTQLQTVSLNNNAITDVTSLAGLTQLQTVSLNNNAITDVAPLIGLTQLQTLSLHSNRLVDVAPLVGLPQLQTLDVRGNLLSYPALYTDIPTLQASGTTVRFDRRTPTTLLKLSGTHGVTEAELRIVVEVQDEQGFGFSGVPVTFRITASHRWLYDVANVVTKGTGRAETTFVLSAIPGEKTLHVVTVEPIQPVNFSITTVDGNVLVNVPDANLQRRLLAHLYFGFGQPPPDARLTLKNMWSLGSVNAYNIQNLTGLEHAYNLKDLTVSSSTVSDVSPLSGLTQLKRLELYDLTISDVTPLTELTQLTYLTLYNCTISDVAPLAGLTQLETLSLGENNISDVAPLAGLTQLETLSLGENNISDVAPLAGLTQLTGLSLSFNAISDVSPLADLIQLTGLGLSSNTISDVTPLAGLTQLTHLSLTENSISDVSPLTGLTQLTELYLYDNSISDVSPLADLTQLTDLRLQDNVISDVAPLAGLTQLTQLYLRDNAISDVSTLTGLTQLTYLSLRRNPLNYASLHTHIPAMQAKGVEVQFDRRTYPALDIISGAGQQATGGESLVNPLVVAAIDANGTPMPGVPVTFTITHGNGELSTTTATTDANGRAETIFTLGSDPGTHSVRASGTEGSPVTFIAVATAPAARLAGDVNGDGVVNIQDLVVVASQLGQAGQNEADVNGDGAVNIQDMVFVAGELGGDAAAPSAWHRTAVGVPSREKVEQWLTQAHRLRLTDTRSQRGVFLLERLFAALAPKETALLANYPNPFNPETWIPYQLAKPTAVTLTIYAVDGSVVRTLDVGHQAAGIYQGKNRAAYWDGKNAQGERVASGLYFYTLSAGDFTATRKMLIRK